MSRIILSEISSFLGVAPHEIEQPEVNMPDLK